MRRRKQSLKKMNIIHVVGARPNFMKASAVMAALSHKDGVRQILVHTGQHYDRNMSRVFFSQLGMLKPHINLQVGPGSHAVQTGQIMERFEAALLNENTHLVVVYGDVNSTLACSLVCAKLQLPIAHVEAGLRSGDRTMPEEINRVVTDQLSALLFTPSKDGDENLLKEGIEKEKIHLVGNVMIDTLIRLLPKASSEGLDNSGIKELDGRYALVTLHRPSNVDDPKMLGRIMAALEEISRELTVIFPVHPRTRQRLTNSKFKSDKLKLRLIDPIGYLNFLFLQKNAAVVITDSGGIQEETTYFGVPCLTVRENTERPITVSMGTNILVGHDMNHLVDEVHSIINGSAKKGIVPPLWDGHAAERIADVLVQRTWFVSRNY